MTFLGAIFIPIGLFCLFWMPTYLLPLLIVSAVFEAGSVFNGQIGHFVFGIAPFYFVEILIGLRFIVTTVPRGKVLPPRQSPVWSLAVILVIFGAWSCMSAFVMPHLFRGVPTYLPREGIDVELNNLEPLQWTLSNLAQAGYLSLNIITVLYAISVIQTERDSKRLLNGFYWAVFIVLSAGIAQRLALLGNWSYPYELFSNNPGYYQGFDQEIGNFRRITSTFGEPSSAGSFLGAVGIGLLAGYLSGKRGLRWLIALLASLFVLVDTTSTTGYAGFAVTLCFLLLLFNPFKRRRERSHSAKRGWLGLIAVCGLAVAALSSVPSLGDAILSMTTDKLDSVSFLHRATADIYSLVILRSTYGMGAGLGSNRASSLLMTLLSSVGLIGTVLFIMLIYKIIGLFPGRRASSSLQIAFWSLIGLLVSQTIGEPDLNRPATWSFLLLIIAQAKIWHELHPTYQTRLHHSGSSALYLDPNIAPTS